MAQKKPIGKVTHYYDKINVAILKLSSPLKTGEEVEFKGTTTDFKQSIDSMEVDHEKVKKAKKGEVIGVKVDEKVREHDLVYRT